MFWQSLNNSKKEVERKLCSHENGETENRGQLKGKMNLLLFWNYFSPCCAVSFLS
jgi:hypothetical protein